MTVKKQIVLDTNVLMATEDYELMAISLGADEIMIPIEALEELDGLKTASGRKGYQARRAIRKISKDIDSYNFVSYQGDNKDLRNDDKMVSIAKERSSVLVTNDIAMRLKAIAAGVEVQEYVEEKDVGLGWHRVDLTGVEISPMKYLSELEVVQPGEYIITYRYDMPSGIFVKNQNGSLCTVDNSNLEIVSGHSSKIGPYDEFQSCAFDSLKRNDLSILTGRAGTGKTLLSVSRILEGLEKGEVDQVVIFTNPTKARGSEDLGFYTGDRNAKLLQNSIGAILISKLGSLDALQNMIEDETLIIMPMSDIRGYEVSERAYLYISEAQNADIGLLQLAIQRASGGPIIIEGDPFTQLDHWSYGGENNGMLRAIEIFKGFPSFSHVHLPVIYRSPIAKQADLMTESP